MIDNVMLLLKGTLSGRPASELMKQCHPLGMFKESTMRSIPTFEASPKGYADLYQTVLIDTPVGTYVTNNDQSAGLPACLPACTPAPSGHHDDDHH